jgi:hypothetical protein
VDVATERALDEADELELVTTGRVSGTPHTVRLRFAYADGVVWLRTGERPSAPDASGVHRRTASDRTSDWLRNLEHDPHALVRIADADLPALTNPPATRPPTFAVRSSFCARNTVPSGSATGISTPAASR